MFIASSDGREVTTSNDPRSVFVEQRPAQEQRPRSKRKVGGRLQSCDRAALRQVHAETYPSLECWLLLESGRSSGAYFNPSVGTVVSNIPPGVRRQPHRKVLS